METKKLTLIFINVSTYIDPEKDDYHMSISVSDSESTFSPTTWITRKDSVTKSYYILDRLEVGSPSKCKSSTSFVYALLMILL